MDSVPSRSVPVVTRTLILINVVVFFFELALPQTLPIVTFRIKSADISPRQRAAAHDHMVNEVTSDGHRWISETLVKGQSVLRMMVISYLTDERHLQDLQNALTKAAKALIPGVKAEA